MYLYINYITLKTKVNKDMMLKEEKLPTLVESGAYIIKTVRQK